MFQDTGGALAKNQKGRCRSTLKKSSRDIKNKLKKISRGILTQHIYCVEYICIESRISRNVAKACLLCRIWQSSHESSIAVHIRRRERVCCLLVLNLVSSTLSCIRQPRPRLSSHESSSAVHIRRMVRKHSIEDTVCREHILYQRHQPVPRYREHII